MPALSSHQLGLLAAIGAYSIWGLFPIYFRALDAVRPDEILIHRIIWGAAFLYLVLWLRRQTVRRFCGDRRLILSLMASAVCIATNWLVFVYAVSTHRTLEASYGYFINPLMIVAVGVWVLKDPISPVQKLSLGLVVTSVAYQTYLIGYIPWIALALAGTLTLYGFIRRSAGVAAMEGLFMETLLLAPIAIIYGSNLKGQGHLVFTQDSLWLDLLLLAAGPATAIPLLLFTVAARNLKFSNVGYLQYIAPSLQFFCGWLLFQEPMPAPKLLSFVLIWVALVLPFLAPRFRSKNLI